MDHWLEGNTAQLSLPLGTDPTTRGAKSRSFSEWRVWVTRLQDVSGLIGQIAGMYASVFMVYLP